MTDKHTVRKPTALDLSESLRDLVTLRSAPPLVMAMAFMVILTGNILFALLAAGITSFMHAFWARLLS